MPHFGNYDAPSFGWPRSKIGVVPFAYKGVAFPQGVQAITVPLWTMMLDALVPHIPGGLKAGTCWGYTDKPLFHGSGIALDVNAEDNPIHRDGSHGPHTLPANTGNIVRPFGMEWGGDWTSPVDYMHIELHISPAEVPGFIRANRGSPPVNPPIPPPTPKVAFRMRPVLRGAYGRLS